MYTKWPSEGSDCCGATEHTPDGRLLFFGPRVAMAVHETAEFECALFHGVLFLLPLATFLASALRASGLDPASCHLSCSSHTRGACD